VKVYIGYDPAEDEAYRVAASSLYQTSGIIPEALDASRLAAFGIYRRAVDMRGQMYDLPSNAPCSTEFAITRFLVPILCQSGYALFTDCDVVFLSDVHDMLRHADPDHAVTVVKHSHDGDEASKMGGMAQTRYKRKNWSSVILFNCDHPANQRLSLDAINNRPGRDLHGFYWLNDSEIGEMPAQWNWLVNVQPQPLQPKIAHFTLGGPWIDGWQPAEHDDLWLMASNLS
jgi:lipopolysaccharide biosynthesis glycosyltransferase